MQGALSAYLLLCQESMMPLTFPDRFWWLQRVWGVLGVLASLAGIVELVIHIAGIHNLFNLGTGWQFFILLLVIIILSLVALALGLAPILLGLFVSLGFLLGSSPARDRFHRRQHAIQGNQDTVPLAAIKVNAADAPRLSDGPLELIWRATFLGRLTLALIELVFVPVFAFVAGLGVYLAYGILTTNLAHLSLLARGGMLLLDVGALVGAPLLSAGLLIFALPMVFHGSSGIIANADGILYRSPRTGRHRMLRWEEVRLFEVEQAEKQKPGKCRLYGERALIQWLNQPASKWLSLNLSSEEFEERHQALLNLIAARTHLLPRTFDKKLAETDQLPQGIRRQHG